MLRRQLQRVLVRGYAAPAKGKGGKAAAVQEPVVDLSKYVPVNIYKEGSHPELKAKEEYPEWLFTLLEEGPTVGELERKGFENLTMEEQRRYLSLANRNRVRAMNNAKTNN